MKQIIYGGAFNPPTIAHYKICEYLLNKFEDFELVIMPSNSYYNKSDLAPFIDRVNMLNIIKDKLEQNFGKRVVVSDLENKDNTFLGTYNTLKELNHPYFVIGADSLNSLINWINGENLIKENTFIVFSRTGYNIDEILERDIYKQNRDHFIIVDDFNNIDVSSTMYRNSTNKDCLLEEVYKYITINNLYKEV